MKAIVLYLHVHQPYRVRHYSIFEAGHDHNYFDAGHDDSTNNQRILNKVVTKSYLPTNQRLLKLLNNNPSLKLSLSITGTILEQLEQWNPEVLESFQQLCATGQVEIVGETYHHSLAYFYSEPEFETQVNMHKAKIQQLFNQTPSVFRNTELSYNNDLAVWADKAGYKGILAEGWDKMLGWRSPNHLYSPINTTNIKLLLKNYRLSDDIAFRFGDQSWSGWPLTAEKFTTWLNTEQDSEIYNLFMDYETFGEHQWSESGIFEFLDHLPEEWLRQEGNTFMTVSEAIDQLKSVDTIDCPTTVTWADTERDLSAWTGNSMQKEALAAIYSLEKIIVNSNDQKLLDDWRRLQTSDHYYYMCTKWFNDGDIHAYFSPYKSPYEAFISFMNVYRDLELRANTTDVVA